MLHWNMYVTTALCPNRHLAYKGAKRRSLSTYLCSLPSPSAFTDCIWDAEFTNISENLGKCSIRDMAISPKLNDFRFLVLHYVMEMEMA